MQYELPYTDGINIICLHNLTVSSDFFQILIKKQSEREQDEISLFLIKNFLNIGNNIGPNLELFDAIATVGSRERRLPPRWFDIV